MPSQAKKNKNVASPKPAGVGRRSNAGANDGQKPKRKRNRNRGGALSSVAAVLPAARAMQSSGQRHEVRTCTRRELVQQVVGTSAFSPVLYPINAGLAQMFPWLSSEARRFEKYRFKKLVFEYVNSVGPADSTNAGGNIAFAADLDVLDAAPGSLQGLMQNENAALFSPYDKARLVVDPADLARRGWLFTRVGGVPSGADAKTYDLGSFILAQSGCSTNGLGNLFVEYVVELDVPQEVPVVAQKITGTTSLSASAIVGADAANVSGSVQNWTLTSASTLTCAVAGQYLFDVSLVGTTLVGPLSATGTATTVIPASTSAANSAGTLFLGTAVVTAQVGQTLILAISSAASVTSSAIRIASYNAALA